MSRPAYLKTIALVHDGALYLHIHVVRCEYLLCTCRHNIKNLVRSQQRNIYISWCDHLTYSCRVGVTKRTVPPPGTTGTLLRKSFSLQTRRPGVPTPPRNLCPETKTASLATSALEEQIIEFEDCGRSGKSRLYVL